MHANIPFMESISLIAHATSKVVSLLGIYYNLRNRISYRALIYEKPLQSYGPVLGVIYASLLDEELKLLNRISALIGTKDNGAFENLRRIYIESCKDTGLAVSEPRNQT